MDASTNILVQPFDAGWQSNILYTGKIIIILTNFTWHYERTYYVLFDSGRSIELRTCFHTGILHSFRSSECSRILWYVI